jgi:ubiquinone/menaquinone biosynthesis C-methylase UbiE
MSSLDTDFKRRWRGRFEQFATHRDDDAGIAGWSASGLDARLRHFARTWPGAKPGDLWLDAGCGAGTYSRFLAKQGLQVIGLDYSLPTIVKAKQRTTADIQWSVADITQLPLKGSAFDGVLCFGVMQALANPEPAVREMARTLRSGGSVWIDALNTWCLPHLIERVTRRLHHRPMHLRYEMPKTLVKVMVESGFHRIHLYWLPILPTKWQWLQSFVETSVIRWCLRSIPLVGALVSHAFVLSAERMDQCP